MNMVGSLAFQQCLLENTKFSILGSQILAELPDREAVGDEGHFKLFTRIVGGCKREEVLVSYRVACFVT